MSKRGAAKRSTAITSLIILAAVIAVIVAGIQDIAAGTLDIVPIGQVILFALLVIIFTARFDRNGQMKGCMTILSLLYAPVLAVAMLLLEMLAGQPWLDPVLGWAGAFRLPAMLVGVFGLGTLIIGGGARLRRERRWRGWMLTEIVGTSAMMGLFVGLFGLAWIAFGAGLRWIGL